MTRDEHTAICKDLLLAIREVAEKRGVKPDEDGVAAMVSACMRAALAIAQAADSDVTSVMIVVAESGVVHVEVQRGADG